MPLTSLNYPVSTIVSDLDPEKGKTISTKPESSYKKHHSHLNDHTSQHLFLTKSIKQVDLLLFQYPSELSN